MLVDPTTTSMFGFRGWEDRRNVTVFPMRMSIISIFATASDIIIILPVPLMPLAVWN